MKLNDSTILRIKVPAHLYESVKEQLTLNEAKGKHNLGAGMEVVKEKKSASDKPKKTSAPKKAEGTKEAPKDGHKKMGLDELKALAEMLKTQIAEMEKTDEGKELNEDEYDTYMRIHGKGPYRSGRLSGRTVKDDEPSEEPEEPTNQNKYMQGGRGFSQKDIDSGDWDSDIAASRRKK